RSPPTGVCRFRSCRGEWFGCHDEPPDYLQKEWKELFGTQPAPPPLSRAKRRRLRFPIKNVDGGLLFGIFRASALFWNSCARVAGRGKCPFVTHSMPAGSAA